MILEPSDEAIAIALRAAGLPGGKSFVASTRALKNKRDKGIMAHATAIERLRLAVNVLTDMGGKQPCHCVGCTVRGMQAREALAQLGDAGL